MIVTAGVLAGAYVRDPAKGALTHAVEMNGRRPVRVLCGRVNLDNLICDDHGFTKVDDVPTCKTCRRRDPRPIVA